MKNQSLTAALTDTESLTAFMGNPLNLLVASGHRNTTNGEDRVYATMQVFDLQLGKSAPSAGSAEFSLEQLQRQLAAAIVAKYTLISQIVVQSEDCQTRNAWMIGPSLSIPQEAHKAWNHLALGGQMRCRGSITI